MLLCSRDRSPDGASDEWAVRSCSTVAVFSPSDVDSLPFACFSTSSSRSCASVLARKESICVVSSLALHKVASFAPSAACTAAACEAHAASSSAIRVAEITSDAPAVAAKSSRSTRRASTSAVTSATRSRRLAASFCAAAVLSRCSSSFAWIAAASSAFGASASLASRAATESTAASSFLCSAVVLSRSASKSSLVADNSSPSTARAVADWLICSACCAHVSRSSVSSWAAASVLARKRITSSSADVNCPRSTSSWVDAAWAATCAACSAASAADFAAEA
mmetsp:Transcript_7293/g.21557  ORF Transcript_7293/g.21557 Transcript_7293/m.21557 type:complete len:280 (+) Transcript_7293:504-1343(+)